MTLQIPCAVYLRLAPVALQLDEKRDTLVPRNYLRCVRIENMKGSRIAIASNSGILAAERLGDYVGPDEAVNIPITKTLRDAAEKEAKLAGSITVENMIAKTTFGYSEFSLIDQTYPDWRALVPELPKKATTGAVFDADDIVRLARSAPHGEFITQKFFDHTKPLICRDDTGNWMGMFLAYKLTEAIKPAEIPSWL